MSGPQPRSLPRQIQTLFATGTFSGLSDRQLLERFLASGDAVAEMAFAVLSSATGRWCGGVCRRILGHSHDAEDALQATFLVLVKRARSVRVEGSLGKWLFGVATRLVLAAASAVAISEAPAQKFAEPSNAGGFASNASAAGPGRFDG